MEHPIEIRTKEELLKIKKKGHYILMNDIDLEGHEKCLLKKFEGQLDGQGYTLRNFEIKSYKKYAGLFEIVCGENAKISNLVIENAAISGWKTCGIITAFLSNGATLENCTVKSSYVPDNYIYGAGVLCGKANDYNNEAPVYIRNCKVLNCVTGGSAITGYADDAEIENCQVENCEFNIHSGSLINEIYNSRVENCFIKNSKLKDISGTLISEINSSRVINTKLIVPEVETNEVRMRRILESPDSYEQLKGIEELSLWGVYTDKPVDFPEVITRLTTLKKLNIGNNAWRNIPESILNLQELEELQLDCGLSYIEELPDLSKLPRLKILRANGNTWLEKHPFPQQILIPQLLKATQVEHLDLSKWGIAVQKARIVRPAPEHELFEGLKDCMKLRILILSHNSFQSPPPILNLVNAEYIVSDNN